MPSKTKFPPINQGKTQGRRALWVMVIGFLAVFLASLGIGRYGVAPDNVIKILLSKVFPMVHTWDATMERVVLSVRLPRLLGGSLVGASLALAGAGFQGMFKNPLVSPDILGVSSGAGFGAALALLLGMGAMGVQISALFFGVAAVIAAYFLRKCFKTSSTLMLVLAGVIVSGFFSSGLSLLKYLADPLETLPAITMWLMGSLASIDFPSLGSVTFPVLLGCGGLLLMRWKLNALSLGDREAQSLGVNVSRSQLIIILLATVITAISVCISGTIGWVGLVIPHLARFLVGVNNNRLLPASALLGATALILLDDIARCLLAAEIPIGILTGIVGTPIFTLMIIRQRKTLS